MKYFADERKRRSLATLYRTMPTAELERRLRRGGLAVPAQLAAEEELQRRSNAAATDVEPAPPRDSDGGRAGLFRSAIGVVASGVLALFVVSPRMAAFVPLLVLPWVLAPAAKAFPRAGLVGGGLFAVIPPVLWFWAWVAGALAWRHGDMKGLETLVTWGVLIAATVGCWAIAGMFLHGARHGGSWRNLHGELSKMREGQLDAIGKVRR